MVVLVILTIESISNSNKRICGVSLV
jgi:hypothetical protein